MKQHFIHVKKVENIKKKNYRPEKKHIKSFRLHKKKKRKQRRSKLQIILNIILICGLIYSLGIIIYHKYSNYTTDQLNTTLADTVASAKNQIDYGKLKPNTASPSIKPTATVKQATQVAPTKKSSRKKPNATKKPTKTADPTVTKSPVLATNSKSNILPQYQKAYNENNDLIGWIHIDNTNVNFPVMYTNEKDYYARRNFDKEYSDYGCIWLDENNTLQADKRDNNLLIYGHNMWRSNTMFAMIHGYEEESYYNAHPTIHFDSLYEEGSYDVIAAVRTEVLMTNDTGFRYYYFRGYKNEKEFNDYMMFLSQNKLYDTGINANYGDELITLSTCSRHAPDNRGRFIVVAKRRK